MNNAFRLMIILGLFSQSFASGTPKENCSLDAKRLYGLIESKQTSIDEKIKNVRELLAKPRTKINEQELGQALILVARNRGPTFNLNLIEAIAEAKTWYSSRITVVNSTDEEANTVMDHVKAQCKTAPSDNCIKIAAYLKGLGAHGQTAYGYAEHIRTKAKSANLNACPI